MALLKSAFEEDGSWDINPKFPFYSRVDLSYCHDKSDENEGEKRMKTAENNFSEKWAFVN